MWKAPHAFEKIIISQTNNWGGLLITGKYKDSLIRSPYALSSMIEKHWKTGGWRGKLLSLGAKAGVPAIFRQ